MFENKRDDAQVKIIDFGLSKKFLDNRIGVMNEGVGECVCVIVSTTRLDYDDLNQGGRFFDIPVLQEHCIP